MNTLLLTSRISPLYTVHDIPHLKPEVDDWCRTHLGRWFTQYIIVGRKDDMRSLPVIQFEEPADMIMFKLRWL